MGWGKGLRQGQYYVGRQKGPLVREKSWRKLGSQQRKEELIEGTQYLPQYYFWLNFLTEQLVGKKMSFFIL